MELFHVKRALFGIRVHTVERFSPVKAATFLKEDAIEPYDEKKHGHLEGAPPQIARAIRDRDAAQARAIAGPPSHKQVQAAPSSK